MSVILVLSIGLMLFLGFFSIKQINFINSSLITTGTVVDLEVSYIRNSDGTRSLSYHPIFLFVDNHQRVRKLQSDVGSNPPIYHKGEVVEIIYNPENPDHAKINNLFTLWFTEIIIGILAIVLFLISGSYFYFNVRKHRLKRKMLTNGQQVEAKITSIELNTGIVIQGRSPYVIYSQWQDQLTPDDIYIFKSENIWFDPTPFINRETITVYIDVANAKRYYVDISFLPKVK